MRVVLDTNVLVSSLLAAHGNEQRVLNLAVNERITWLISEDIAAEYEEVLHRPELKLESGEIEAVLKNMRRVAEVIKPQVSVNAARDEDDNRFLECAEAGQADYLVTGNRRHFPPTWGKTRVVSARQLLEEVGPENRSG